MKRAATIVTGLLLVACAGACTSHTDVGMRYEARPVVVQNIASISVMPFSSRVADPDVGYLIRDEIIAALQRNQAFYVRAVDPDDLPATPESFRSTQLTLEDLARLRRDLGTDGMLLGWVDRYETFPHARAAVYVELIDLATGERAWHVDGLWHARDQVTAQNMKHFYYTALHDDASPHGWNMVQLSPALFREFVAWEIVSTLRNEEEEESEIVEEKSLNSRRKRSRIR